MFALPSAPLPSRGRLFTGCLLLLALVGATPSAATFAQTSTQQARVDLVQVQRPIAEDFTIDQRLVATLPAPTALPAAPSAPPAAPSAPTAVVAPTLAAGAAPADDAAEQRMAAFGPPRRAVVPQFNAIWPTRGEITTYFGEVGPYSPRGHPGLDVAGPQGTSVVAMDDGEILKAYWDDQGYGGLVIIGHPSGYETWYGHLARFSVEQGDQVKRGEPIGLMGSTGYSTGPHLHFEVRQDGQLIDPLQFLTEANLNDADW